MDEHDRKLWADTEALLRSTGTLPAGFLVGDEVLCIDATNHAHFLRRGKVFTVDHVQTGEDGRTHLFLAGMACGWPPQQFLRVAALPALLEACREALFAFEPGPDETWHPALTSLREAIAAATGAQP